jgi:hypothetical protein
MTRSGFDGTNVARKIKAKRERDPGLAEVITIYPGEPKPRGDVDDGCRWLVGQPEHRNFCGAALKDQSWCDHHLKRVFV